MTTTAIDVSKYREVPLGSDGHPRHPDDPPDEIVRAADGRLYKRRIAYWAHVPKLEFPERASPLLVHALRKDWWHSTWTGYGPGDSSLADAGRIATLAALTENTAGNDERIAWGIVNLEHRVVLPIVCDLAGLTSEAARMRGLPVLTAKNMAGTRRTFRAVERAAERIAPWVPSDKRPPETEVEKILDRAESRSGLLVLGIALIGCDVEGGSNSGDWPAVQRAYRLASCASSDADHAVYRAAGKVATIEQAERFAEQLNALVEMFLRGLPRSRRARRAA